MACAEGALIVKACDPLPAGLLLGVSYTSLKMAPVRRLSVVLNLPHQLVEYYIYLPPGVNPTNIYHADLATWSLDTPPRFIVELDRNGEIASRLSLAREPDCEVVTA